MGVWVYMRGRGLVSRMWISHVVLVGIVRPPRGRGVHGVGVVVAGRRLPLTDAGLQHGAARLFFLFLLRDEASLVATGARIGARHAQYNNNHGTVIMIMCMYVRHSNKSMYTDRYLETKLF